MIPIVHRVALVWVMLMNSTRTMILEFIIVWVQDVIVVGEDDFNKIMAVSNCETAVLYLRKIKTNILF
ncbi:hypothetical protein C9994_01420 [Marivirga lumbricoides]|uniref:Uncharacterized protein n=1 Tax=Marivirga lumbricoides TaxID=1046115 RepID=A0A2T4DVB3_9BACT|nr:hypothetical protein C9994_01420 [Marivirga lumbricoides]